LIENVSFSTFLIAGPELLLGGVFKQNEKELDNYFELVQELKNVPYSKFAITNKGTRVDAETLRIGSKFPENFNEKVRILEKADF